MIDSKTRHASGAGSGGSATNPIAAVLPPQQVPTFLRVVPTTTPRPDSRSIQIVHAVTRSMKQAECCAPRVILVCPAQSTPADTRLRTIDELKQLYNAAEEHLTRNATQQDPQHVGNTLHRLQMAYVRMRNEAIHESDASISSKGMR